MKVKVLFSLALVLVSFASHGQGRVVFNRDLSPAQGLVTPQEHPFRKEICLNGLWDFQPVAIPENRVAREGTPPAMAAPAPGGWESVKIKIPSPWNVNEWGAGSNARR